MQNLLFFRDRDETKDPRWGASAAATRSAAADLASAAVFGLRNIQKADYAAVRTKYVAVSEACNTCHRTFARDAPTIKP
jgi:cytochrome c556